MKLSFLCLPLLVLLAACGPPQPTDTATAAPPLPAVPGPDLMALADSNAARLLLAYGREYPGQEVVLRTRLGTMRIRLYEDTPIHAANFLLLSRKGVFDESVFNRVVKGLVIQGGGSEQRTIDMRSYRLPPEIRPHHFHKRGALAMARYDGAMNPDRLSSNNDFYIVQGEPLTPEQARAAAGRALTPEQVKAYSTGGGVPGLDGQYTVFGEVVEGLDVIDKIANEPVGMDNWPTKDVGIKVEVLK
ncbi:peptidylprolyl isomerase [Hymenobacter rubripertinctus]|uniref:Peptidyl-prolyl cis-trans isomerase n=1 Tax=Hymenobacter rubripertinctus TaxID=2029981 RepID=A0A418QTH4_9BACT|nr:peptidylprolyl isomerase [Hymenobacter rubripertinctus]RIY08411.1 peptidylprolyl isomerase [Hymenobacter rubripertinctus]